MTHVILALILLASCLAGLLMARILVEVRRPVGQYASWAILGFHLLLLTVWPDLPWLPNVTVILAGGAGGFLLGQLLGSVPAVLTFLGTAALVDLLSFSGGLTNRILDAYRGGGSGVLRYMAVFLEYGGMEYAVVGITDIAMIAAAWVGFRTALGVEWESAAFLLLGISGAFVVGIALGGVPGIPFLALGAGLFVFLHRRKGGE